MSTQVNREQQKLTTGGWYNTITITMRFFVTREMAGTGKTAPNVVGTVKASTELGFSTKGNQPGSFGKYPNKKRKTRVTIPI